MHVRYFEAVWYVNEVLHVWTRERNTANYDSNMLNGLGTHDNMHCNQVPLMWLIPINHM